MIEKKQKRLSRAMRDREVVIAAVADGRISAEMGRSLLVSSGLNLAQAVELLPRALKGLKPLDSDASDGQVDARSVGEAEIQHFSERMLGAAGVEDEVAGLWPMMGSDEHSPAAEPWAEAKQFCAHKISGGPIQNRLVPEGLSQPNVQGDEPAVGPLSSCDQVNLLSLNPRVDRSTVASAWSPMREAVSPHELPKAGGPEVRMFILNLSRFPRRGEIPRSSFGCSAPLQSTLSV